jgi:hypothetical protein
MIAVWKGVEMKHCTLVKFSVFFFLHQFPPLSDLHDIIHSDGEIVSPVTYNERFSLHSTTLWRA